MRCNPGHLHRHIHHHHHHSHCGPCYGGSIFTFSHHCGGHSGGFWSGFGAGLGMGLGNMLGGFMNRFTSGFGNMFGGFGMGSFGFGMPMFGGFGMGGFGFGMPMMGGFGLPWAANYGGGTVKDDAYFASKYGTGKSSSTSSVGDDEREEKAVTKTTTGKIGDIKIDDLTKDNVSSITSKKYDALSDGDKADLNKKFKDLAKGNPGEAVKWANSKDLPEELVKIARESFYIDGNSNYDGKEQIDASKIVRAHDTYSTTTEGKGFPGDVKPNCASRDNKVEITPAEDGKHHPKTIKIYDDGVEKNNSGENAITYTYEETKYGEYIYKSDRSGQEYVLQKTSDNKYELVQYPYHIGWKNEDAHSAQS